MKLHPIELLNYFFPVQEVRANPLHDPEKPQVISPSVDIKVTRLPNDEERHYACELILKADEESGENATYLFTLHAYGVFSIADKALGDEEGEQRIKQTALQLLIGVARERISEMTSRGPWPNVMLGVISLVADDGNPPDDSDK